MKTLWMVGLCVFTLCMSSASPVVSGATLLGASLLALIVSASRHLAPSPKRHNGLPGSTVVLLSCASIGATGGLTISRSRAREDEYARVTAEESLQRQVERATSLSADFDTAEGLLATDDVSGCDKLLAQADARLSPLRASIERFPVIRELDARRIVIQRKRNAAAERLAVARAEKAIKGGAGLGTLLEAFSGLSALPSLSADGRAAQATLEARIKDASRGPALGQPREVLEAKLIGAPAVETSGATIKLTLWRGSEGVVETANRLCTGFDLVATKPTMALSESTANGFIELVAGALKAAPDWQPPPGAGSRERRRTFNGIPITEGWFDARLVELYAGTYRP